MPFLDEQIEDAFFDAYNLGREANAKDSGLDFGVWSAILDGNACDFCAWANGRTFQVGDQHLVPPAHFGCRCLVAYYSTDMLDEGEQIFLPWEDPPTEVYPFGSKEGK